MLEGNWGQPKESSPLGHPQPHAASSSGIQILRDMHYLMYAHVGKGSPMSDATSATSDEAWNRVGDLLPETGPHSSLARGVPGPLKFGEGGTGTGVLAWRYLDRGDSVTWMQPPSVTRSGTRPGAPPACPAIRGRGCNLSYMCGVEPDR